MSWHGTIAAVALLLTTIPVAAQHTLMARVKMPAEVVMAHVQTSLVGHGYAVAHEQKCDGGMTMFGFETDYYRVAFFGKIEEVRRLSEVFPELTPYLPLKIAVVAEQDETLLIALDPAELTPYFHSKHLGIVFRRWRNDILSVFGQVRQAADTGQVTPEAAVAQ